MLSRFRHANLVSLIGFCNDGGEMILVYDFMTRGTLRDHLYGSSGGLSWERRLKICVEAARGLQFLHGGVDKQSVIHRDVKSTNILLDEDWVAKVSDFGLSKVGPNASHVTTDVKGSFGYLDPEYYMSLWLTQKSDVYSFGVVLLEVLCARAPIESTVDKHQGFLVAWVRRCYHDGNVHQTVDPALKGAISPKCLKKFVGIALSCLNDHGKERPLMKDVVKGLEHALTLQRCYSHGRGGALKEKSEEVAIDLTKIHYGKMDERFGEVMHASSSGKPTTNCSEEEQALVHEVFQTAR
uniref:Receptor-like protein kinase ANXUR1 n=2 Tax=Cajanus cajan TaxID=3821 RepID=A0A151T2I4_CAJCA|nr:Receptor-like protein kinase ANXUR1 [Cajanus cajan]